MAFKCSGKAFIKVFRKFLEWEWYDDINTSRLFIHCLLKANWKPAKWHGIDIEAGQFITSLNSLSEETQLSVRQVRVALNHLIATGEVTSKCQSKFRIITINNWDCYQGDDKQDDKVVTSKRQGSDKVVTTDKEEEEEKEEKEEKENNIINYPSDSSSVSTDVKAVIDKWNDLSIYGIRPVKSISEGSTRNTQLKARLKQYTLDDFQSAIDEIKQSSFLKGQSKTGWMITFDWFIKPSNFQKVLEGNYNDKREIKNVRSIQGGIEQYSSGNAERDRELAEIVERINNGDDGESLF